MPVLKRNQKMLNRPMRKKLWWTWCIDLFIQLIDLDIADALDRRKRISERDLCDCGAQGPLALR